MNKFILLLSLLPVSIWACPNLSGHYRCQIQEDRSTGHLEITSRGINFQIKVGDSDMSLVADGRSHTQFSEGYFTRYKIWCDKKTLHTAFDSRKIGYRVITKSTLSIESDKNLSWNWHIQEFGKHQSDSKEHWVCSRI